MKNLSPKTAESYAVASKHLIKKYGNIDISALTYKQVIEWYEWLLGWQTIDTAKNNISCVRMVLKYIRQRGVAVLNYEDIPVPQRQKRRIKYLTEKEVRDFINEVSQPHRGYSKNNRLRNKAIVTLLYATGIRNSELCALNRDSIKDRTFTVIGKSKSPHISFITEEVEKAINEYLLTRTDKNPALFVSGITGNRISSSMLRDMFQTICARSIQFKGIHPHTIRHSFGTKMLEKMVDLRYIGDLMGHADLNTTRMYTHYTNPQLREIYNNAHNVLT